MPAPSSWLQLAHKTAIVTGAASGIGAAVARALALEHSCHVVLVDRDSDRLQDFHSELVSCTPSGEPMSTTPITCNVAKEADVKELFQSINKENNNNNSSSADPTGGATILINCAGITRDGWIGRMSLEHWQQVQDVNLTGTFLMCREFLAQPHLQVINKQQDHNPDTSAKLASSRASIVNVSSVVATHGNLGQANYAASKGGVIGLTKALAKEVAARRIRVNCVLPGFIETEMTKAVPDHVKHPIKQKIVWQQEFGEPDDIANLILFLASDKRSRYITGEAMECSGMIAL